jgi:hypothetical protein
MGEYEGIITASAGEVTAYADVMGEVTAPATRIGDVNMDGSVSISDVTTLIDYLLSGQANPFDSLAADVNADETISISDVTSLIDLLLSSNANAIMWNALPAQGGLLIDNPIGETLEVYNLDADGVARVQTSTTLSLPGGIYMVTSDNRSRKVIVR